MPNKSYFTVCWLSYLPQPDHTRDNCNHVSISWTRAIWRLTCGSDRTEKPNLLKWLNTLFISILRASVSQQARRQGVMQKACLICYLEILMDRWIQLPSLNGEEQAGECGLWCNQLWIDCNTVQARCQGKLSADLFAIGTLVHEGACVWSLWWHI